MDFTKPLYTVLVYKYTFSSSSFKNKTSVFSFLIFGKRANNMMNKPLIDHSSKEVQNSFNILNAKLYCYIKPYKLVIRVYMLTCLYNILIKTCTKNQLHYSCETVTLCDETHPQFYVLLIYFDVMTEKAQTKPNNPNKSPVRLSKFLLLMMMHWPMLGKFRLYLKLCEEGLASTSVEPELAKDPGEL